MSAITAWLAEFRDIHQRAKKGGLSASEEKAYLDAREQFGRSLVAAQGLTVPEGASARHSFRVAQGLQVDIGFASGNVRAVTSDVSCGGFSVILAQSPNEKEMPGVTLKMPGGAEPLLVRVAVASITKRAGNVRASFAFHELPEANLKRLEMALFDLVLARIPAG